MDEKTKKLLANFIIARTNLYVKEIIDVHTKMTDDEIGVAGKHFIVQVKLSTDNIKTCYVNKEQFDMFIEKQNSVIWA